MEITCVWDAGALLGEGPVWDQKSGFLYWVDIKKGHLHRYGPSDGSRKTLEIGQEIGCIALRRGGGLVAAVRGGFAFLDPGTGALDLISDPEQDLPGNRFNDGKCDPAGRFLAGSMDDAIEKTTGALYSMDSGLTVTKLFGGYTVCNGPAFSPEGDTLYFSDTVGRALMAFDYDPKTGTAGDRRLFARIPEDQGLPDGLTVDSEGGVWNAHWDGWRVTRYLPDGKIDRVIELPVPRPTSCAFGGEDLDMLYITSARAELDDEALAAAPLSGGLFSVKMDVRGVLPDLFGG